MQSHLQLDLNHSATQWMKSALGEIIIVLLLPASKPRGRSPGSVLTPSCLRKHRGAGGGRWWWWWGRGGGGGRNERSNAPFKMILHYDGQWRFLFSARRLTTPFYRSGVGGEVS